MEYIQHEKSDEKQIIQEVITQRNGQVIKKVYERGRFLRQSQNSRHYEVRELTSSQVRTIKVISKSELLKSKNRLKLLAEIKNHKKFNHKNILKFHHVFEDNSNIYIIVESSPNGTMQELLNRRVRISEQQMQYYFNQLVDILIELKNQNIVHRDIKLQSLYLDNHMVLKLGDFGESAECLLEKRRSIIKLSHFACPEIINQSGHAFEADLWSVGVVIYTLLCGVEPFKTGGSFSLSKIKNATFMFPQNLIISDQWKELLKRIFVVEAQKRISLQALKQWKFQSAPHYLPNSLLAVCNRFKRNKPPSQSNYLKLFSSNFPMVQPPPSTLVYIKNWQYSEEVGLIYTVDSFLCINFQDKSVLLGGPANFFEYRQTGSNPKLLADEEIKKNKNLSKKVFIFKHFKEDMQIDEVNLEIVQCPFFVETYNKVDSYLVMKLSNKTIQICFQLEPKDCLVIGQDGKEAYYQNGVRSDNDLKINQYLKAVGKQRKRCTVLK